MGGRCLHAHLDFTTAFEASLKGATLPPGVTACAPDEAERRFAVYRNNVASSLTEALARRFPVIQRLVGPEFFAAMARFYAEAHRPRSPVLLEWGDSFPDFLAGFPPLQAYPYMADVAAIEFARGVAFHAADGRPAAPEIFAGADPSRLRLRLHPSVQVLRLTSPAVSIWTLNQPGSAPASLTHTLPEIALILRDRAFNVPVRAISAGDATLIEQLGQGATLMAAAEMAQWAEPQHDPQPLVLRLIQSGAVLDPMEFQQCAPNSVL